MARVVFYTFGILREDKGHPLTTAFYKRMPRVFRVAETTPGFIDRREDGDFAFGPRFFEKGTHVRAPQTLSLWRSPDAVRTFAADPSHADAIPTMMEAFHPAAWPSAVMWWIEDDHVPSWQEAWQKLEQLHEQGPTAEAFSLDCAFEQDGTELPAYPGIAQGPPRDSV